MTKCKCNKKFYVKIDKKHLPECPVDDFKSYITKYCSNCPTGLTDPTGPTFVLTPKCGTNANVAINTPGNGFLTRDVPDGTSTGGDCRGKYAVDFQSQRDQSDQVAKGDYSVILNGNSNTVTGPYSSILNGVNNLVTVTGGTILNGVGNKLTIQPYSVAMGNYNNDATGIMGYNRIFMIGNGSNDTNRSNCFSIDVTGNIFLNGVFSPAQDYSEFFENNSNQTISDFSIVRFSGPETDKISTINGGTGATLGVTIPKNSEGFCGGYDENNINNMSRVALLGKVKILKSQTQTPNFTLPTNWIKLSNNSGSINFDYWLIR